MRTIILPGYSPSNAEWAREAAKELEASGLQAKIHEWAHWHGGKFNPGHETKKILSEIGSKRVNILAKSVGTEITNRIVGTISDQIHKIILCGIPSTNHSRYQNFAAFPAGRIVVFQNENDPWATYQQIVGFLSSINPKLEVINKPRSDHHYPYYKEFSSYFSPNV